MQLKEEARKKRLTRISSKLDSLALPSHTPPSSGKTRPKEVVPKTRVEEKERMRAGGVSSPTTSQSPMGKKDGSGGRNEATVVVAKSARRWS